MSSTSVTDALSRINAIQTRFQKYFSPSINSSTSEETATVRTNGDSLGDSLGDFSGDSSASTFSLELGAQPGSPALANTLQNGGNSSLGFSNSSLGASLSSSLGASLTSGGASLLSPSSSLNGLNGSSSLNAPSTPNVVGDLLTQQLQNQIQRSLSPTSDRGVAGNASNGNNSNQIEIENKTPPPVSRSSFAVSSGTNQAFPYEAEIREVAKRYDLPVALIRSVVKAESNFNPFAISSKGAMGLMQLMPETAQKLGVSEPFDVAANLDGGTRYLRELSDQYKGDYAKILSAYNAGDAAVARTLEKEGVSVPNYPETQNYIKKVLDQYLKYSGVRS